MSTSSKNWIAFGLIMFGIIAYTKLSSRAPDEVVRLPDLKRVELNEMLNHVHQYDSLSAPSRRDKYDLGYTLIAFNFTKPTLPKSKNDGPDYRVEGGGLIRQLVSRVKKPVEELRELERRLAPQKQEALERGLQIWLKLASQNYSKATFGLAWYYGKIKDYRNAFYFSRVSYLNGLDKISPWVNQFAQQLSDTELSQVEERVSNFVGASYQNFPGVLTTTQKNEREAEVRAYLQELERDLQELDAELEALKN
tara:strand:+ start:363 stop:1118 length:756 start_codon:yes stop_codon:yes gene_type:complete